MLFKNCSVNGLNFFVESFLSFEGRKSDNFFYLVILIFFVIFGIERVIFMVFFVDLRCVNDIVYGYIFDIIVWKIV